MRLSRAALAVSMIVLAGMAGCIENMGDLKEALGVVPPPPAPEVFEAPIAKAHAPVTTPLVGVPVSFLSEGSADPKGLALRYDWDFGDGGRGSGAAASHAYGAPGEYLARLVVTNSAGLSGTDTLALRVLPANGAPTVSILGADPAGLAPMRGQMGEALAFTAVASDPEGGALDVAWAFGDGASAEGARASHAYAAPGVYDVRVKATDAAGQAATASTRVAIDASWSEEGAFAPASADAADVPFLVAQGARLQLALTFPAGFGLNDVEVVLLDAAGEEVARSDGAAQPGAQGDATRELEVAWAPSGGAWTARVVREGGIDVAWTLEIIETV